MKNAMLYVVPEVVKIYRMGVSRLSALATEIPINFVFAILANRIHRLGCLE